MPPNKSAFYVLVIVCIVAEVAFAKISPPLRRISRQDEKLLLRTKRQHCTCLNVRVSTGDNAPSLGPGLDALDSTYRCTCNSASNPAQQQRELQQILQQVEPLSRCTCAPGGLSGAPPASFDSPLFELQQSQQQWDCNCINGGQAPRPSPQQFFPWNRPVAAGLLQEYQNGPRFSSQQAAPIQQANEPPTTLPSPIPPFSSQNSNQQPLFADNPTPLAPLPNEAPYQDFNPINEPPPFQGQTPPYPIQQGQVTTFRIPPDGNGIVETYNGPPIGSPKCPCMEVVISVTRTDANGNRYPATQPLCICAPTTNQNLPVTVRPAPLPVANNDPIRQPLVPPQPQFQPPLSNPTPVPRVNPVPITPVTPNPRGPLQPSPAPLPVVNPPVSNAYYDSSRQPYRPVYPTSLYAPAPYALGADEPAIMPCVMTITIGGNVGPQQCNCQENYRQCSATQCCNHKAYRSLRADPTTTSATPSAVDLLLEFADRFKKHLEAAQQSK